MALKVQNGVGCPCKRNYRRRKVSHPLNHCFIQADNESIIAASLTIANFTTRGDIKNAFPFYSILDLMQEPQSRYVVSDICDTLFFSNTTFDFIRFCIEKGWLGNRGKRRWGLYLRRGSLPFWALAVLNKLTGSDFHKKIAVGLLKGYSVAAVSSWAARFYQEYLLTKKVDQTFAVLQQLADETQLVLASSSIEPVVAEVARAVGASRYVATMLEVTGDVYTGRIALDLTGKKTEALKELFRSGVPVAVLSDNTTDRSLMELAENGYAICYNDVQRKFWSTMPRITLLDVKSKVA